MIPAFSYQMTLTHGLCDLFTGTEPRKTKNERSQLINPRAQIATAAVVELHQNVRPDTAELPGRVEPNKSGAGERVTQDRNREMLCILGLEHIQKLEPLTDPSAGGV